MKVLFRNLLSVLAASILLVSSSVAQDSLDVTFRFLRPGIGGIERAFLPGTFNGWGQPFQGNNSCIVPGDESEMTWVRLENYWRHTVRLEVGQRSEYKIQTHFDVSGTNCEWLSDPLNPDVNAQDNNNSIVVPADPMVFQPAEELSPSGLIGAVSAGLFSLQPFADISFIVNGIERTDGLDFYDNATGIFRFELDREIRTGAQFKITATDSGGRTVEAEIGRLLAPITWTTVPYRTVDSLATIQGFATRLDGTVDPDLTEASLLVDSVFVKTIAVDNGNIATTVDLLLGENELQIQAMIEGQLFTSDPLVLTKRLHPLERVFADINVAGSSNVFIITLVPTALAAGGLSTTWLFDADASTTDFTGLTTSDVEARGTATGPGELYFDITMTRGDGETDFSRIAVVVEPNASVHTIRYEENPRWVKNAVVYEIFPLSFGSEATGTAANPGTRFSQITDELDYIAQMGFNVIWFMPIYDDQFMSQVSAGYNIVDFYQVDPKLGTNADFKELVDRAHELGIKIILDLTPSHVSPVHPWVNSLRNGGPFADYIQTIPNSHSRGLDSRGANLPEIWQSEGGANLYRKYDGFGDLANLDWDNDDLQAEMLDVVEYWVREFDIDGWRLDVYWGPWRRYGPDRFGRPVREFMKRIKPDSWILGEIAGTGFNTEVYYADDDFGNRVIGGLDAAYDWTFYHDAIRSTYGSISNYDSKAHNGDFWAGPNARVFRFLENHDEARIADIFRSAPERILPLTGFLLTTTGVPMVFHGQEVNYGAGISFGQRTPVSWQTDRNGEFARYYQRMIHVRRQFPAFGTQTLRTFHTASNVYGYVRPLTDANAVVLVNFSGTSQTITTNPEPHLEMSTDGPVPYYDILADTTASYLGGFEVSVPPYETVVYITSDNPGFNLPDLPALPFGAVYTGSDSDGPEELHTFRLEQNYPNPAAAESTIRFWLPSPASVNLTVFDLLGRKVAVVENAHRSAGEHSVSLSVRGWPGGVYLYRLQAGSNVATRTLLVTR